MTAAIQCIDLHAVVSLALLGALTLVHRLDKNKNIEKESACHLLPTSTDLQAPSKVGTNGDLIDRHKRHVAMT